MARRIRGKISFQPSWTDEFPWVREVKNNRHSAQCAVCRTTFSVETMGRTAIVSHSSGMKHKNNVKSSKTSASLDMWTSSQVRSTCEVPAASATFSVCLPIDPSSSKPSQSGFVANTCTSNPEVRTPVVSNMRSFVQKDEVTRAETLWCLQTVINHDSLRGAASSVSLFRRMFPDDHIANNMHLQKDKISYMIVYGLAPYFHGRLKAELKDCEYFVLSFDESINKVAQKQQMDICVRFWDSKVNQVSARYLTSVFLHHTTGEDLLEALKKGLEDLDLMKIIQLSMDGPNVNFKVLRLLKEDTRSAPDSPQYLDIGSCGLHTVHNAFKTGFRKTDWQLVEFFRALFNLFKESPSRRGDYIKASGSSVFPLKVCSVRWVENGKVARKAKEILPHVEKYVRSVEGTAKMPSCLSFSVVSKALKDKLLPAKIAFFEGITDEVEPFLKEFQTGAPMAPFLYDSLTVIVKTAMSKIVKKEIIESTALQKIDVLKENASKSFITLKDFKHVDLGYGTRAALAKCEVTEKDILCFRKGCRTALQYFVAKLMERSPLRYPLTKGLACLNPCYMSSKEGCEKKLTTTLDIVLRANLLPATTVERADREYKTLCSQPRVTELIKSYSRSETRLDTFWMELINGKKEYENLIKVVKLLLIISHGNANVESGFSINKEILIENLKEHSLIAQRRIFDSVTKEGGLMKIELPKQLLHSVRNAHSRYCEALKEQRVANAEALKLTENKKRVAAELRELEAKKCKLLEDAERAVSIINERVNLLRK